MPELTLSLWPYSSSCKSNCFFLNLVLPPDPVVYPTAKGNDKMSTGKEDQKEGARGHQSRRDDIWAQAPATFKVPGSPRKSISRLGRTPKMLLFHSCFWWICFMSLLFVIIKKVKIKQRGQAHRQTAVCEFKVSQLHSETLSQKEKQS